MFPIKTNKYTVVISKARRVQVPLVIQQPLTRSSTATEVRTPLQCLSIIVAYIGADAPEDNPDTIGIEGAMKYFGDIKVELDEVCCFGIAELLKSPSMGEFTREGFLEGWRTAG